MQSCLIYFIFIIQFLFPIQTREKGKENHKIGKTFFSEEFILICFPLILADHFFSYVNALYISSLFQFI